MPGRSPLASSSYSYSLRPRISLGLLVAAALTACDSGTQPPAGPPNVENVVRPGPASGALAAPMPVRPSGLTNASKQDKALDRTNSTSASGESRVPEPPLTDNPPPGGRPLGTANNPASSPAQSVTSQSKGTNPPPDDGTLPTGTTGSTNRGGGLASPR